MQRHVGLLWLPDKLTNATRTSLSHYLAYEIFNLKLWFENNLHRLRMDFLSIGFCKQTNKQNDVFHLVANNEWKDGKELNDY